MSAVGGKYEIGERLGGGGMADVFRATVRGAEGFAKPVAIKRIKRSISNDEEFAALFVSEATLAAKLHHPNVVQTLDFDRDENGCFYLVMELIDGVDLRALGATGPLPISVSCYIVSELLRGLDYAHELVDDGQPITVIHRDISPHNIMVGWQGAVKVVDFGIAKAIDGSLISRSGSIKGKVAYMSPEQVHGHELDGRSDLFAAGVVLHELLTGERLFVGDTEAEIVANVLTRPIAPPSVTNPNVPKDLDAIVLQLLARDRDARTTRARDALESLLESSVSVTRGRSELETLLTERYPDRAPRRKARLSRSPSPASGESAHAMPASTSSEAPKRTMTAGPLGGAHELDAIGARTQTGRHTRWPAFAALTVALVVLAFALARESGDERADAGEPSSGPLADRVPSSPVSANSETPNSQAEVLPVDASTSADADPKDAGVGAESAAIAETTPSDRRGAKAELTIRVKPWAVVIVDGKRYGQTPQTIRLRRGKHRISLSNDGLGKKESFSLTLQAGQKKTVIKNWVDGP